MTTTASGVTARKMVSVRFLRTSNIPDRAMAAVHSGVSFILDVSRAEIKIEDWRNGSTHPLDGFQTRSLITFDHGFGYQVDATKILSFAREELARSPERHFMAMIIDRDLNDLSDMRFLDYISGKGAPGFGFILSLARFNSIPGEAFLPFIRRMAAHEFGHALGLVGWHRSNAAATHCSGEKGPCLMRKGDSVEMMAEQELCPDCQDELRVMAPLKISDEID